MSWPRLTFEYVKEIIEKEGYKLLSTIYVNASEKLLIQCTKGHIYEASWDIFNRGNRCKKCSVERTSSKQRHSLEYIREQIEHNEYKLLSNNYKNASTKLILSCSRGHIYETNWNAFQGGTRCYTCFGTPKKNIDEIRSFSKSVGYELLSNMYINAVEKLKFKCPNNHIFECSWNNFGTNHGSRCPICWSIQNRGPNHCQWRGGLSFEPYCEIFSDKEFREYIKERDGYKCLNPCCSKKSNILAIHHIDYIKKNCNQENLITLCSSCNGKANYNRDWYKLWYQILMNQRYGFIYKEF